LSIPVAEDAVEDDFLGLPDEGHGDGERGEAEEQQEGGLHMLRPEEESGAEINGQIDPLRQGDQSGDDRQPGDDEPAVERGELPRFLPQGFIGQHQAELPQDNVQVEHKNQGGQDEDADGIAKVRLFRHAAEPEEERAEAEIDEAGEPGAVERVAPRTFLRLEAAHLPEAEDEQAVQDKRGHDAQGLEEFHLGGLHADDQPRGQAPEQRRQPAREASERAEELWVG